MAVDTDLPASPPRTQPRDRRMALARSVVAILSQAIAAPSKLTIEVDDGTSQPRAFSSAVRVPRQLRPWW